MDATRPVASGLLVVLILVTATVCGAGQAPSTSITFIKTQEVPVCDAGQAPATIITSPATQGAQAADPLADYALPLPTRELEQVSGGALTLVRPEQLQQSAAGVKLWDEARMRPAVTVESGPGQIQTNVSVQQTQFR